MPVMHSLISLPAHNRFAIKPFHAGQWTT